MNLNLPRNYKTFGETIQEKRVFILFGSRGLFRSEVKWKPEQIPRCNGGKPMLSFLESILFAFVKQIGLRWTQVDNLRTAVAVLFKDGAFLTIISIADSGTTANDASALKRSIVAFFANSNQCRGPHIGIADYAFAVTFFAETADSYAGLLSTKYQIRMMACHNPRDL